MPSHQLYALAFPEESLDSSNPSAQRRGSDAGTLDVGPGQVRTISAEPGERRLAGDFRGNFSDLMAGEIQELLSADDIDAVPYYERDNATQWQGYYEPREQREADRRDPRLPGVHRFAGRLRFKGTRRSHIRSLAVTPGNVTNPMGSGSQEDLWVPNVSVRPRWVSQQADQVEDATVQETQPGERVDYDRFNATDPAFSGNETYTLTYDLPYDREWQADPVVWDTRGDPKEVQSAYSGDTVNGTGVTVNNTSVGTERVVAPAWQKVYDAQHDYQGERVIDSGRLRLEPRPDEGKLRAYQWDDTDGIYDVAALDTTAGSVWELDGWDIRRIGTERVVSRSSWVNRSNASDTYELVAEVPRGYDTVLFYEPENAGRSTPADLITLLDPISYDSDRALGEEAGLFERSDLPDE